MGQWEVAVDRDFFFVQLALESRDVSDPLPISAHLSSFSSALPEFLLFLYTYSQGLSHPTHNLSSSRQFFPKGLSVDYQ